MEIMPAINNSMSYLINLGQSSYYISYLLSVGPRCDIKEIIVCVTDY